MKTSHACAVLVISFLGCFSAAPVRAGDDDKKEDKPLPPELKVLDWMVGSWREEVVQKPAEWTPKETRMIGVGKRQWILGGRVLENKGTWQTTKVDFLHLQTYDTEAKAFRQWYYDSSGALPPQDERGQWDDTKKTMTWKATSSTGQINDGKVRFIDNDHFEWSFVIRDAAGKILLDMHSKVERIKKK